MVKSPKRKSRSPKRVVRKAKSPKRVVRKAKSPKRKSRSPKRKSRNDNKRKSRNDKKRVVRKAKSPKRKSRNDKKRVTFKMNGNNDWVKVGDPKYYERICNKMDRNSCLKNPGACYWSDSIKRCVHPVLYGQEQMKQMKENDRKFNKIMKETEEVMKTQRDIAEKIGALAERRVSKAELDRIRLIRKKCITTPSERSRMCKIFGPGGKGGEMYPNIYERIRGVCKCD